MIATSFALALGVHLGSYHFNREERYNEVNLGLFVRGENWQAGFYNNSEGRLSTYATFVKSLGGAWEVQVGGATGYEAAKVVPVAALVYTFDSGLVVSFIPAPKKHGNGVVHLGWRF